MEQETAVMAMLLLLVVVLAGGWALYSYQDTHSHLSTNVENAEIINIEPVIQPNNNNMETPTTSETATSKDWLTVTIDVNGKEMTMAYPSQLPLDTSETIYVITSPDYPNYSIPLTSTKDILSVELTTDLKYFIYSQRAADDEHQITVYKVNIVTKETEKVDEYNLQVQKLEREQLKSEG